jgi:FkbH-like protein
MALSLINLPWLPPAPADLSALIRALGADETATGADFQRLAGFALNAGQAAGFARALRRARDRGADLAPLSALRLGLLAGNTHDLVADAFAPACARHGVAVEVISAAYGQVMQEALDPASTMNAARPDVVLVAVDHRWLGLDRAQLDDPAAAVERASAQIESVVRGLREHGGASAILQTLPVPPQSLFGSYDRRVVGSVRSLIDAFNIRLLDLADRCDGFVLDAASLAERIGVDAWFDPVHWYAHKLPFAPACAPIYADHLGRLLGAIRGKARKCLVLDLDNTLWGGVIGDDGLAGIRLGQGDAQGEAFLAVQQMAAALHDRGVILAVSSKNDEAVAREPFRAHAEMALRESHIAAFQANWNPKSGNLEAIARTLNIGLDALVLLDDNPAERAQVRAALPIVAVPELPSDPSWFPWVLYSAGYFEAVGLSQEDRLRASSYAADADRAQVQAASADLGDYLAQLQMRLETGPFSPANRPRVTQLINKTNQFNLTTRRYTEAQVEAFEQGVAAFTLQARLIDRFSDLGLIATVICTPATHAGEPAWEIDSWLMSCRVLGRGVEQGLLAALVEAAGAQGVRRLRGVYRPTAKNGMVAGHYEALGFERIEDGPQGEWRFVLDVAGYERPDLPFAP